MRRSARVPLTLIDAKRCCVCRHWHRVDTWLGQCRHPRKRWGVCYRNEATGAERHVAWWTTGCYATCDLWEEWEGPSATKVTARAPHEEKTDGGHK